VNKLSHRFYYHTFCIAVFVLTTFADTALRYRHGLNSFPVHVRIAPESDLSVTSISLTSIHGGKQKLHRVDEAGNRLWSSATNRAPIEEVELRANRTISAEDVEIRFGLSWESSWIRYSPKALLTTSNQPTEKPQQFSSKIIWEDKLKTHLPRLKVGRNWQGDIWLFIPPICKGLLAACLAFLFLTAISTRVSCDSLSKSNTLLAYLLYTLGTGSFLVLLLYLTHSIETLIHVVDGRAFFISFVIFTLIVACSYFSIFARLKPATAGLYKTFYRPGLISLWVVLFILKIAFVFLVHLKQTGDFSDYQRLGEEFANNTIRQNWDHSYPLLPLLAARAFTFSYPLIAIFGPSSVGYINCFLQIATALLIGRVAKYAGGERFSLLAAYFFLFWPDFLLSTPVTTHDISGYFWLTLGLLLIIAQQNRIFDKVLPKYSCRQNLLIYGVSAFATGFSMAMIEWTRGFLPFLLASTCLYTAVQFTAIASRKDAKAKLVWLCWLMICIIFSIVTSFLIKEQFTRYVNKLEMPSMSDYIASDSTRTDSIWYTMHPFRFNYLPAVPRELRNQLKLNKLLFEKCILAAELPLHAHKKTQVIARPDDYLHILKAGIVDESGRGFSTRLEEILRILSYLLTASFAAILLTRIAISCIRPLSTAEWLVYGTGISQLGAVLLLTESAGAYDAILGICASVALAVILSAPSPSLLDRSVRYVVFCTTMRGLLGLVILSLCWFALLYAGSALKKGPNSFIDFRKCAVDVNGDTEDFEIEQTETSLVVRYIGKTNHNTTLPKRKCRVSINCPYQGEFQGFLSGNQYRDAIPSLNRFAPGIGTFSLRTERRQVAGGDISDLNRPKWIAIDILPSKTMLLDIEIVPSILANTVDSSRQSPVLAIEFLSQFAQ
jgi:hypothetical protein